MEFEALIRKRSMIRAFRPTPLTDGQLHKLLRNAIRAPSAGHLQPWEFIIVRDDATKRRLARAALDQNFIAEAPLVIVTCANTRRSASVYGERGVHFYSLIDVSFASLLLMLTAINEGLGCCFVGAYRDEEVSRILGLPAWVRPVGIIPVGHPAEGPARLSRIPLRDVVHEERWSER